MGAASAKPTIALIVEDEFLVRMLAVDIFTDSGFEAIEAANADEAIRILESRGDIEVIFTDINMPGSLDGVSLAYVVRRRWPSIRTIVTSALRMPGNRPLPEGSMFLAKPYQSSQITHAVRALCGLFLGGFWFAEDGSLGEDFEGAGEALFADLGRFGGEPAEELHAAGCGEAVEFFFEAWAGFQGGFEFGRDGQVARCEIDFERDADDFAYVGAGGFAKGCVYLEAIAPGACWDEGGASAAIIRRGYYWNVFRECFLSAAFGWLCCGGVFFRDGEADVFGDVDIAKHPDFVDGG